MYTAEPLIDDNLLLQKFPGKGGWTYTVLPQTIRKRKTPFGWIQVNGFIDSFELKAYKLMPMKSGELFLPVRAEVRNKINKHAGDWVHIVLFAEDELIDVPNDFLLCLKDGDNAYKNFLNYTVAERKAFIDFIALGRSEDEQIKRMAECLDMLENGIKLQK